MHLNAKAMAVGSIFVIWSILLFNLYSSRWFTQKIKQKNNIIWEPFNRTNPHIGWCSHANCSNSPICTPCRRRFLLIISTGRSGSTTLLSMMNQLPGVRLAGENRNEILKEMDATNNLFKLNHIKPNENQGKRLSSSSSFCYCRCYCRCCCHRPCFITMGYSALNGNPSSLSSSSSLLCARRHRHILYRTFPCQFIVIVIADDSLLISGFPLPSLSFSLGISLYSCCCAVVA